MLEEANEVIVVNVWVAPGRETAWTGRGPPTRSGPKITGREPARVEPEAVIGGPVRPCRSGRPGRRFGLRSTSQRPSTAPRQLEGALSCRSDPGSTGFISPSRLKCSTKLLTQIRPWLWGRPRGTASRSGPTGPPRVRVQVFVDVAVVEVTPHACRQHAAWTAARTCHPGQPTGPPPGRTVVS